MKKSVLIIDDDFDFSLLVSKFLNQNGYETQIATSGESAISKLRKFEFHAVLCDFCLGDMDGKEFLLNLKKRNLETIVIFMTGYANQKTASDILELGAYDYLEKPLIPGEILLALSDAFAKSSSTYKKDQNFSFNGHNENKASFSSNSFML